MTKQLSISFSILFSFASNCYAQTDSIHYKIDLGNPFRTDAPSYYNPNGKLNRLSPDSTMVLVNEKLYHTQEIDRMSDEQLQQLDQNTESINVVQGRHAVDSVLHALRPTPTHQGKKPTESDMRRIKALVIIRLRDSGDDYFYR